MQQTFDITGSRSTFMVIRYFLAVRGLSAVFALTFAGAPLLASVYFANAQIEYDAEQTNQRWGSSITGSVIANSGNNAGITTALVRFPSKTGNERDIKRIMPATAAPGTPVRIWEDTEGDVFVQGAATGNRYKMWHTVPGPNPTVTYLLYLVIAAVIALPMFVTGDLLGYLLTCHRI